MKKKLLSAGVVVVNRTGGEWRYLLLRAFDYWDFPKGVVEAGERPLDGAIREVEEETTLTQLNFRWGHIFKETGPYGRGKVARYYLAETDSVQVDLPISPELKRPEHEEYRWLSYAEAMELVRPRVASILQWARANLETTPSDRADET